MHDDAILLQFIQGDDGAAWQRNNKGWQAETHVCEWYGITCDESGSVTSIDLPHTVPNTVNLHASIPSELGQLKSLERLDLHGNIITGEIPSEVLALPKLTYLNLADNLISGSLPQALFLSQSLEDVNLQNNLIDGTFTVPTSRISPISRLNLSQNFMKGLVPWYLCDVMVNLVELDLSQNDFEGQLPKDLDRCITLRFLYLHQNRVFGSLPATLGPNLVQLYVHDNAFSGTVPATYSKIATLEELFIDSNKLTGNLPGELCNRTLNTGFYGMDNYGSQEESSCDRIACAPGTYSTRSDGMWPCTPCPQGTTNPYLGLHGGCISRDQKTILGNFISASLSERVVYNSDGELCLVDGITCDGTLNVTKVSWSGRSLTGQIPSDLGFLEYLEQLDLSDNLLSGSVPSDLRFAPLMLLDISGNNITGVPPELCKGNINGGDGNGPTYNCDIIACPTGTYSPIGRAGGGQGYRCMPCSTNDAVGSKTCNWEAAERVDKESAKSVGFILAVGLLLLVILFLVARFSAEHQTEAFDKRSRKNVDNMKWRRYFMAHKWERFSLRLRSHKVELELRSMNDSSRPSLPRANSKLVKVSALGSETCFSDIPRMTDSEDESSFAEHDDDIQLAIKQMSSSSSNDHFLTEII